MNDSNKKLLQFVAIFVVGAFLLFFLMSTRDRRNRDRGIQMADTESMFNRLEQRIDSMKTVLEDDPHNDSLLTVIANCYFDLSQFDRAIEYYEKSLALNPDNPFVLTDCAVMYFQAKNSDKALEYLDKAISLKPDLAQAYFNKGLILMTAKDQPQNAMAVWQQYIDLAPESEQAKLMKKQIEAIESSLN
jgi:tetratricopeptide (TPR) repeat protein